MGDNETVVAQTSEVLGHTSESLASAGYSVPNTGYASGTPGEFASSVAAGHPAYNQPEGPNVNAGNEYTIGTASSIQEPQVITAYETQTDGGNVAAGSISGPGNAPMESMQATNYSSENGNVASEPGSGPPAENGSDLVNVGGASMEHQYTDGSVPSMSAEEERLWSIVRANSLDFNAWTALIEETEKVAENDISKIRKVYDAFLAEFPLCYGYWKKYADHEARFTSNDKVVEVYERAVLGVTYSVDIWLHYCLFATSTYSDPETIRRLFERGLAYVGTDYLSYPLWDRYIEYEYSQQDWGRLALIYTRILENPIQQLDRYFNSFKELARSRPLSELKSANEIAQSASLESEDQAKEDAHLNDSENAGKPPSGGSTEEEELEKYIGIREEMYKKAKEFDAKIIDFETAIRRPYFHVRPLSDAELENWHNYLDFIEKEADFSKIVKLYERCLIACANYPDYWMRYILCMQASGSMDLAENALARATQVFVKRQPEIHLFAARFKEENEDLPGARASYQLVHAEISPGLIEAIVKHASMEYRLGNKEDACSLYEQAIAIEKGKEHSQTLPMLYAQYARFICLVGGNAEKAREILVEALDHVQMSKPLLEAMIHLESIQSLPKRIDYLDSLVDKFIVPNADSPSASSDGEREELSSIFVEFLYLFGDVQSIKKASDRHAKLFLRHRSISESRKRHADDFLGSDKAKVAKTYAGAASTQSLMGAYPNAQSQWATSYGAQAQPWPQATQAQGQQWPAGYTPQAAYSGYAYGTNYTTPQVSAPAPQTAAYGTYPPTYPGQQAYAQQSYTQPAAAANLTPAQPVASAQQAYYGTY